MTPLMIALVACHHDYQAIYSPEVYETVEEILETTDGELDVVQGEVVGPELDILWVIDTSCSMSLELESIATLASGVAASMQAVPYTDMNWKMGAISADPTFAYGGAWTDDPALVPDIFDAVPKTNGEAGLEAAMTNLGWDANHRTTANLLVIFIADEDDNGTVDPTTYLNGMDSKKPAPLSVSSSAIVHLDTTCTESGDSVGHDYMDVSDKVVSLCDVSLYPEALEPAESYAAGSGITWNLPHEPLWPQTSNIIVSIDGNLTTDWQYDPVGNNVILNEQPDTGSYVYIAYIY